MALLQCVVERRLLEIDLARFPKTLLAFLFLAEIHKSAIFAITSFESILSKLNLLFGLECVLFFRVYLHLLVLFSLLHHKYIN